MLCERSSKIKITKSNIWINNNHYLRNQFMGLEIEREKLPHRTHHRMYRPSSWSNNEILPPPSHIISPKTLIYSTYLSHTKITRTLFFLSLNLSRAISAAETQIKPEILDNAGPFTPTRNLSEKSETPQIVAAGRVFLPPSLSKNNSFRFTQITTSQYARRRVRESPVMSPKSRPLKIKE